MKLNLKLILISALVLPTVSFASTTNGTIIEKYAWGENSGWVNLLTTNGNITITDSAITGYAWDARYGWINMNPTNGGVLNNGEGNLSGHAWSMGAGWIDFDNVSINSSGKFTGTAIGDVYGTLTFNCDNCNVTTDWRPASVRNSITEEEVDEDRGSRHGGTIIYKTATTTISAQDQAGVNPPRSLLPPRNESNTINQNKIEEVPAEKTSVYSITEGDPIQEKEMTGLVAKTIKIAKVFLWILVTIGILRILRFFIMVLK